MKRVALQRLRAAWLGLIVAQLVGMTIVMIGLHRPPANGHAIVPYTSRQNLICFLATAAFMVIGGLAALVARGVLIRQRPTSPHRYATACLLFQGPFALAAAGSIACVYISHHAMPHVGLTGMALVIQVLTFPTGAPVFSLSLRRG